MKTSLWTAAGLGAVSGLRTLQPLAWTSRRLARKRIPRSATRVERALADSRVANALSAMAALELAGDKLPAVPHRIAPGPLAGRAAVGALVGAIAAGRDHTVAGAVVGAGSAIAAAVAAWAVRRELGRATMLPDAAIAMAEDAIAIAAARELTRDLVG
jgi:uncharacterized membrane protein